MTVNTNLLAYVVMSWTLATNWTDLHVKGKELGYVQTNHVASVVYQGVTNRFILKSDLSDRAVWREPAFIHWTNSLPFVRELLWTNIPVQGITNIYHMPGIYYP